MLSLYAKTTSVGSHGVMLPPSVRLKVAPERISVTGNKGSRSGFRIIPSRSNMKLMPDAGTLETSILYLVSQSGDVPCDSKTVSEYGLTKR